MDLETIKERREAIERDARCTGCRATLTVCTSWGEDDPDGISGCCWWNGRCHHVPDQRALRALLVEIESGHVRTLDEVLLDSVDEFARERRVAARILATWVDRESGPYHGE